MTYDPTINNNVQFFFGVQELGTNVVWRPMNPDPTLYLNYYNRTSNITKPAQLLIRYIFKEAEWYNYLHFLRVKKDNGEYSVDLLECSPEMLKVFGQQVIDQVFRNTEVLETIDVILCFLCVWLLAISLALFKIGTKSKELVWRRNFPHTRRVGLSSAPSFLLSRPVCHHLA